MKNPNDINSFEHADLLWPSRYLKAADLRGRDVTVTIANIEPRHELTMRGNVKEYKPVFSFTKSEKLFVCNKTNGQTLARILGPDPRTWIGQSITLYPTRVQCGREQVDAVRVRETRPTARTVAAAAMAPAMDAPADVDAPAE